MKKHEQRRYLTQQDTKREKGTRKEGRKGGHKGRRTSPLAKVGRSREGFTLFWGLRPQMSLLGCNLEVGRED